MKKHTLKRYLASLLAVLMLISVTGVSPAVFADDAVYEDPVLQNGNGIIVSSADVATVKQTLAKALISNYDKCNPDTRDNLDWEYECVGYQEIDLAHKLTNNTAFGDIAGFTSSTSKTTWKITTTTNYKHDALAAQPDNTSYKVRLKGTSTYVTFTKLQPQELNVTLNENVSVVMPYTSATTVDYATLEQRVLDAAVKSTNCTLTRSNTDIKYYAKSSVDEDWMPLSGGKGTLFTYPAVSEGTQKVKLSFKGEGAYSAKDIELNVTFTGRQDGTYTLKENPTVGLKYTDATTIDYSTINEDVFNAVIGSSNPQLSASDVTITYFASLKTGSLTDADKDWMPLTGGKKTVVIDYEYAAVTEGTHKVRIVWGGNANYNGFTVETDVTFTGRENVPAVSPSSFSVNATFNEDLSLNYDAIRAAIWAQIKDKLPDNISYDEVSFAFQYNFGINYWLTFEGSAADLDFNTAIFGDANPRLELGENTIRVKWGGNSQYNPYEQTFTVNVVDGRKATDIIFKENPTVKIQYNDDISIKYDELYDAIWANVVESIIPEGLDKSKISITYKAKSSVDSDWMPLEGGKGDLVEYPAIDEGTQTLRFVYEGNTEYKGFTKEVEVTFTGRDSVPAVSPSSFSVNATFNEDLSLNYEAIREAIWAQIKDKLPDNISYDEVSFAFQYDFGINYWLTFEGSAADLDFDTAIFGDANPRLELGENTIRVKWGGDSQYKPYEQNFTVNVVDGREASDITFKESPKVKILYNDDINIKYEELYAAIWENVVDSITPEGLDKSEISITYYATAETGSAGSLGHAWASLNGETIDLLTYPAIGEGTQKLRFVYAGSTEYKGFSKEVEVEFIGRDPAFALKEGVESGTTEVSLKFADASTYDYDATAQAIREALLDQCGDIDLSEVTVKYKPNALLTEDLNYVPSTALAKAFGEGEFTVVLSWGGSTGTALYKPFSAEVKVNMVDNRIASEVKLNESATITYNMDANVMIENIIANAVDMENSTVDTNFCSASDFTVEFKDAEGNWTSVAGEDAPNLGAGENQTIRIKYNGSKDYKPSDYVECTLTVEKANVKVSMKRLTIAHAADSDIDLEISLDPNDPAIDVYTVYVGINTKNESTVYVVLPESKTQIIDMIDKAQQYLGVGEADRLKAKLQDGITIGELREALNNILSKLDTEAAQTAFDIAMKMAKSDLTYAQLKDIYDTLNNISSLADNLRIAIGTPNHAGLYQAFAIAVNDNYNTAFSTGTVVVLMNVSGMKLVKNPIFDTDNQLTVEEAQAIKNGEYGNVVYLQKNGNPSNIDQSAVRYLYSGITDTHRLYSSTSDFPTAPGKYVVTVVTLGGDYLAAPITFTFKIVDNG